MCHSFFASGQRNLCSFLRWEFLDALNEGDRGVRGLLTLRSQVKVTCRRTWPLPPIWMILWVEFGVKMWEEDSLPTPRSTGPDILDLWYTCAT